MKLHGKTIEGPNQETIIIPRGDGQIVLKAQAILDFSVFNTLCPEPTPQMKVTPGGVSTPHLGGKEYQTQMDDYAEKRMDYLVLGSLDVPENGLEWETVKMDDPTTWKNYRKELKKAGFSEMEVGRILQGVMAANALDENKIELARQRFLASQQEATAAE